MRLPALENEALSSRRAEVVNSWRQPYDKSAKMPGRGGARRAGRAATGQRGATFWLSLLADLRGSRSRPGGNLTGLPGYNAAQVILANPGLKAEWMPELIAGRLATLR
jgi:hypothetical protein